MSLKIQLQGNLRAYPILGCDYCGAEIEKTADGNALWLEAGSQPGECEGVRHVHSLCTMAFERANPPTNPDEHWKYSKLDHFFFMLLRNAGYDAKAGKRTAKLLGDLD